MKSDADAAMGVKAGRRPQPARGPAENPTQRPAVEPAAKRNARRLWVLVHRWIGLTAGLLFALIGLTGSLLVFDHAIDEWLNPELLLSQHRGRSTASLQSVIDAAEASYGGPALSVSRPRVERGVFKVWFQDDRGAEPRFVQLLVDPATTEVTGRRVWGQFLMSWVYRLHFRLLGGAVGATLVGIVGVIALVSLLSGLYLWWPLWRHSVRAAFAIRRGKRNYDVHKLAGSLSAVFLVVISFTGVSMEFPDAFRSVLSRLSEVRDPPTELKSSKGGNARPLSADEAITRAKPLFPDAEFDHLHPPVGPDGVYEVAFRQPGEIQRSFGRSQVFLDQYSGKTLLVRDPSGLSPAEAFIAWQFPLHNGEAFGLVGRWLVLLLGMMPALLYVTGLAVWWRRAKAKR